MKDLKDVENYILRLLGLYLLAIIPALRSDEHGIQPKEIEGRKEKKEGK